MYDALIFDDEIFDIGDLSTPVDVELDTSEGQDRATVYTFTSPAVDEPTDIEPFIVAWDVRNFVIPAEQVVFVVPVEQTVLYVRPEYGRIALMNRNRPNPGTFNPDTGETIASATAIGYVVVSISEGEDSAEIIA